MADRADITPELLRQLLRYEPETGKMFWRRRGVELFNPSDRYSVEAYCKSWNVRFANREALTSNCRGYRMGQVLQVPVLAHRVAWAIHYGRWPDDQIDHINGDKFDNRISNMRDVSCAENMKNRKITKRNKSGVIGVRIRGNRFLVQIAAEGRFKYLGSFGTIEEAADVRRAANVQYGYSERHGDAA